MAVLIDEEFGEITLRRSPKASYVRIRVGPDGRLRASLPLYAPLFLVKRLIRSSRGELRTLLEQNQGQAEYAHGMPIGKSHTLIVRETSTNLACKRHGQQIVVSLPSDKTLVDHDVVRLIRKTAGEALRIESKAYLPKRLAFLAEKHHFSYEKVRFSHASGRWGSCSSNGTISLNIALMKLPFELIDYVLVHELCHTVHMNHSDAFWQFVEAAEPQYRTLRRRLKNENPSI